jgi:muconolactone delta-isomerase
VLTKEKMSESVRADKKARYEELVRHASLQVLARVPILFAVDDHEARRELEDLLRSSVTCIPHSIGTGKW